MSTDLYESPDSSVIVTRFVGPFDPHNADRRRVQITTPGGYCDMSYAQWVVVVTLEWERLTVEAE